MSIQTLVFNPNFSLTYTLRKHTKAKGIRVVVLAGGEVVVTIPKFLNKAKAEHFLLQKTDWLQQKIMEQSAVVVTDLTIQSKDHYKKYKETARKFLVTRVALWAHTLGLSYKSIKIKNTHTRWGSCSRKGNLNFHYKIIFLPTELQDYLIVHELCHLCELNHSPAFWQQVSKALPQYKIHRKN